MNGNSVGEVSNSSRQVILQGSPSLVVDLPMILKAALSLAAVILVYRLAAARWAIHPAVCLVPCALIFGGVAVGLLQTIFTEVIIDAERITRRRGILSKQVTSLELFRIQDVVSYQPWWQRPFGIGSVVVATSDSNNPVWGLPGIAGAEKMRDELNRAAIALRDRKGIREVNMGRV